MTDMMEPTTATGRCITFSYNMKGLNVQSLRLIRVDIGDEEDVVAEDSGTSGRRDTDNFATAAVTSVKDSDYGALAAGRLRVRRGLRSTTVNKHPVVIVGDRDLEPARQHRGRLGRGEGLLLCRQETHLHLGGGPDPGTAGGLPRLRGPGQLHGEGGTLRPRLQL